MIRGLRELWARLTKKSERIPTERSPRIVPGGYHRARLALLSSSGWKDLQILNISTSGLGVEDALQRDFCVGQQIQARLFLDRTPFELTLEVRRREFGVLGLRVVDPKPSYQTALVAYFRRELEAVRMIQVPAKLQKRPEEGEPIWFRGSEYTELYMTASSKELLTFQLAFFGHFFEYDPGGSVRYGLIVGSDRGPSRVKESELVSWEAEVDREIVDSILAFVENINGLSEFLKKELTRRLTTFPVAGAPRRLQADAAG